MSYRSTSTAVPHPATDARLTSAERKKRTAELIAEAHRLPPADREAVLDEVIRLNIPVAHSLAARYRNRGQSIEDLEQVACLALTRAVRAFTPDRGDDLLVLAVPSILGELKRYFRDSGWAVRPPRRLQELRPRMAAAQERLTQELGRTPSDAEVATAVDGTVRELQEAQSAGAASNAVSLDRPVGDVDGGGNLTLADVLPTEDPGFRRADALAMLAPAWRRLQRRDRRILRLRFYEERTQQQIADELGVSQVQVSRLLRRILADLRTAVTGGGVKA